MSDIRRLVCACCGRSTWGRQWYNRDTGYGLCGECIVFVSHKMSAKEVEECYGRVGEHYCLRYEDVKEFVQVDRRENWHDDGWEWYVMDTETGEVLATRREREAAEFDVYELCELLGWDPAAEGMPLAICERSDITDGLREPAPAG